MPKDYAKFFAKKSQGLTAPGWRLRLVGVLFIFFMVSVVGYGVFFWQSWQPALSHWFNQEKIKPAPPQVTQLKPSPPAVHFHFYTELPKTHVNVSKTASEPKPTATTIKQYWLEIACFTNIKDAREKRIALLLQGIDAQIQLKNISNQTLYSIVQGPFANVQQAKKMLVKLQTKGQTNIHVISQL